MRKALALVTTLILSGSASADTVDRFYLRADIGAAHDMSRALPTSPNFGGGNLTLKSKTSAIGDIGIGYNVSEDFRAELVFIHRFDPKMTGSSAITNAAGVSGTHSAKIKAKIETLMLRWQFDMYDCSIAKLFLSAGVGLSQVSYKGTVLNTLTTDPNRSFKNKKHNNFAYAVGVGTSFKLKDRINFDIQYNWFDFGKAKKGGDNVKYRTHTITAGLRYEL